VSPDIPDSRRHLVYVWWEPTNADQIPELVIHQQEVNDLRQRLGDASPRLHALTYTELFAEWGQLDVPWIAEHIAQLQARYSTAI